MARVSTLSSMLLVIWYGSMSTAFATTKGLNQIVTPDIQPQGTLSVSLQQVDPNVANRYQTQLELGVTKQFEVALFQGFSPPETVFNAEYGLVQRKNWLLSTGFANYTSKGGQPQPYLEAGYIDKSLYLIAGAIRVIVEDPGVGGSVRNRHQTQSILGAAYRTDARTLLQVDYQAGSGNFATAGFTYSITPQLQFNPSAYLSNSTPHQVYGYAVLTWTVSAWK